jgi:hypothetical protein
VYREAVTTSPTTDTAIGHIGYSRPFSQVKTISEQLPTAPGPDVIKPRSAAEAGLTLIANPKSIAVVTNFPNPARIVAPKADKLQLTEQKSLVRSIRSGKIHPD